jgi:hypothetical protein
VTNQSDTERGKTTPDGPAPPPPPTPSRAPEPDDPEVAPAGGGAMPGSPQGDEVDPGLG